MLTLIRLSPSRGASVRLAPKRRGYVSGHREPLRRIAEACRDPQPATRRLARTRLGLIELLEPLEDLMGLIAGTGGGGFCCQPIRRKRGRTPHRQHQRNG